MANVGAQDPRLGAYPEAVDDSRRVHPGAARLGRDAEPAALLAERRHQPTEFIELNAVEFPVRIGGVNAVHPAGVQAVYVLPENRQVETARLVERRRYWRPYTLQVVPGKSGAHGNRCCHVPSS